MTDLNGTKPKACGDCRHWHKQPGDPRDLGAPAQGQCRFNPPVVQHIVAQGPQGLGIVSSLTSYPTVPHGHPACAQHAARLALTEIHQ